MYKFWILYGIDGKRVCFGYSVLSLYKFLVCYGYSGEEVRKFCLLYKKFKTYSKLDRYFLSDGQYFTFVYDFKYGFVYRMLFGRD